MHHLLLFELDRERISHLVFQLKEVGIHCTIAKTVEEILSLVHAAQMKVINFDLIVLDSLHESGFENLLLTEICRVATVPVVCVQSQQGPLSIFLTHDVITCQPETLVDCVSGQLSQ